MTLYVPTDNSVTIQQLIDNPYPIYKRYRAESPVIAVSAVNRIMLTKAEDTRAVKNNPTLFSSDDPNTPMTQAFEAHTLMRKDGADHRRERMAMMSAFGQKTLKLNWAALFRGIADEFVASLPKNETVDLFSALAGPFSARCLVHMLGLQGASDSDMQRWSQTLIDGAGNFGGVPELFKDCEQANIEMNACIEANMRRLKQSPDTSALSVMVNAEKPIPHSQIISNIKIAIGGGINEPRDALCTILFGLLTNPEQLHEVKANPGLWAAAFEEGVRWCAPIQISSRLVTADTEIRGYFIPKGDTVMTIQASANHDEDFYDEPEKFNIFRDANPHQSFGNGPHFCMGAHSARRMLADILLPKLLERFPNMQLLDPEIVQWKGFGFRGPLNLPALLK